MSGNKQFNAVTLLKKSDAALTSMARHFAQSALSDSPLLPKELRIEIEELQVDIKAQVKHIEKTGELEQSPHMTKDQGRAPKGGRHGKGKGGGMTNAAAKKMRADRVATEKAEEGVVPGFYKEPDDAPEDEEQII